MPVDVSATVRTNTALSGDYCVLTLEAPSIASTVVPGQFVMVKAGRGFDPLLRRPFSVFEIIRDASGRATALSLLVKRIGPSTERLYALRAGDRVDVLGPLGVPFTVPPHGAEAWMVAGGVGLAPFWTLTEALVARGHALTLFYGARSAADLFYLDWFESQGVRLVLTTEDGSRGERGRIIAPLDRALAACAPAQDVRLFVCGPEGMLAATARTAAAYHRPCEVSVERVMGCGMGGCYSCVVPMRGADGRISHVRSCLSGPVLDAAHLVWD